MAYHFKSGESVPEALRRIVSEEFDSAVERLTSSSDADRDEAVHEARKSVKKVRAVLRLVETDLGDLYATENVRLRDIGRKLSELRDAGAIIEALDGLIEKYRDELGKQMFASVRRGLVTRKGEFEQRAGAERLLRGLATSLRAAGKRAKAWPLGHHGFSAIEPGLRETFRRGKRALALALEHSDPANFHEWRKRVKDHWYHVRLLENLWPEMMEARAKSLKDLETWLGEDHNFVVLRDKILTEPDFYGSRRTLASFFAFVERYQRTLREDSVKLGARIYAEKPGRFTERTERLWRVWQDKPKPEAEAAPPVVLPAPSPNGGSRTGHRRAPRAGSASSAATPRP
jgi:CHAD domain-containing protein